MTRVEPSHICTKKGCYNLQPCPVHPPRKPFEGIVRPSSSTAQGYGAKHRAWRAEVLRLHPFCWCGRPSTDAHHIVRIKDGGARFDVSNGVGLCHEHHSQETARRAAKR